MMATANSYKEQVDQEVKGLLPNFEQSDEQQRELYLEAYTSGLENRTGLGEVLGHFGVEFKDFVKDVRTALYEGNSQE